MPRGWMSKAADAHRWFSGSTRGSVLSATAFLRSSTVLESAMVTESLTSLALMLIVTSSPAVVGAALLDPSAGGAVEAGCSSDDIVVKTSLGGAWSLVMVLGCVLER